MTLVNEFREVPKIVTIYDLDISVDEARLALRRHFRSNNAINDPAVKSMLVEKGYMDLEETLMMWKQKAQIMRLLDGYVQKDQGHLRKMIGENPNDTMGDFFRNS